MMTAASYFTAPDADHLETETETDAHATPPRGRLGSVVGLGGQVAGGMVHGDRLAGASQLGAYTLRDAAMIGDASAILEDRPTAEHGDDIGDELAHLLRGRRYATDGDNVDRDEFIDALEYELPASALSTESAVNRWTTA